MASLFDLFNNNNAQDAANAQIAGINTGTTQALGSLNQGLTTATNTATAGSAPTLTNLAQDQAGQTAYANATGANGPAGNAAAIQNFQTGPGYQFQLDQGTQNALRNQASTGQLASGATDAALQTLGQGQANQAYQQYVQNLSPFIGASTQNAGTSAYTGTQLAGLQNANYGQQGSLQYGAATSAGNATANADLANNAAAANQFGALKSVASLGSSLLGFL